MSRTTDSPGVMRASELVAAVVETQGDPIPLTRRILSAALDVEAIAIALFEVDYESGLNDVAWAEEQDWFRERYRKFARAVVVSILGDES